MGATGSRWGGRRCAAVAVALVLRAGVAFAQTSAPVANLPPDMAAHVLACALCHGPQGQGGTNPYFPRLAAKPAGYLFNQLQAFQQGRRRYAPMNYLLEYQRTDFLKTIASFFAAQSLTSAPQAPPTASQTVLAHGQDIVAHGVPETGVPPCSACHGSRLTGMQPAIPGLIGLNAQYITAQLGAWRYGTRTATAPDCMQSVAARLTDADVTAVAAWLSSQPLPADPSPAAAASYRLPLHCGSEPQ